MSKDYIDDHYCPVCKKDTPCEIHDAEHERDSSNDRITCTICGAQYYGFTGTWETKEGIEIDEE